MVAGGSGMRMGSALPKQFLEIDGKALIIYALEKFIAFDPSIEIILVLGNNYYNYWESARLKADFHFPVKIATGGKTRFHSVKNGIGLLEGDALVGIHDAVRPLVSVATIGRVYAAAKEFGSAIPTIPLKESVREHKSEKSRPLNRSEIRIVQTPQVFRSSVLRKSYETEYKEDFTDDASVVENAGFELQLVSGDEFNLKITTPEDLEIAKILLTLQKQHPH